MVMPIGETWPDDSALIARYLHMNVLVFVLFQGLGGKREIHVQLFDRATAKLSPAISISARNRTSCDRAAPGQPSRDLVASRS